MSNLDLALIGNGSIGALVDPAGEVVWACLPRFDGDAVFCSLLRERKSEEDFGYFSVELIGMVRAEQQYMANTPVLVTKLYDAAGNAVELTDFAPRFRQFGRLFCPMTMV
ncbi:MAG: trehalase-like domain-containing protein, partial [Burkholderiales bacterium]